LAAEGTEGKRLRARAVHTIMGAHVAVQRRVRATADAAGLAETLQFLTGWHSSPATRPTALTSCFGDLERFIFLLGGSDGEPLFGP
jgi:hypothetical protein